MSIVLAACGGGGSSDEPAPATPAGPVATDQQAKTLAARSIDALFAYDNMNSEALLAALVPLPVTAQHARARPLGARPRTLIVGDDGDGGGGSGAGSGPGSGTYTVNCVSGSGTTTFIDADRDHHVSAGDSATFSGTACKTDAGLPWALGGSVKVSIVGGSNIERHLYFVEKGSAQLTLTHAGTAIGGGRTASGDYLIAVSNAADGAPPDQQISIPDMTIAHPDVTLRMVGVSFEVAASKTLATAAGRFETTVDGLGTVALSLAVKTPLTVDSSTPRFRPSAGTVTLTGTGFGLDVQYGAGDAVTIRVDNGLDGSVDRTVTTTVAELDALLTVK